MQQQYLLVFIQLIWYFSLARKLRGKEETVEVKANLTDAEVLEASDKLIRGQISSLFFGTIVTGVMLFVGFSAQNQLSEGTVCDSDDLETTVDLYLITLFFDIALMMLTLLRVFQIKAGLGESLIEGAIDIWPSGVVGTIIRIFAYGCSVFKLVWFIMFCVAYAEETQDCLDDADEVFDDAHGYLKTIIFINTIPYAVILVCSPFIIYGCVKRRKE